MTRNTLIDRWENALQSNYGTPSIQLIHGSGCEVWDESGKRYLDFLGGIATTILGHAHPEIVKAVANQVATLNHVSNFYAHPQILELAEKLKSLTGNESARVFFANSGAEVNEAAIKLSRLTGRKRLVSCQGSFHGRTIGALSITGQSEKREPFYPLLKRVSFAKFNDVKSLRKLVSSKTAAVFIEPIQGEKGVVPASKEFLQMAREITAEKGALLVIDAVQTGMGRTGEWFGFEFSGITPDVITLAKGLGGGLPIGAMIAVGAAAKLFTPGSHGSTFGGNPIAAASANATINVISSQNLLSRNFHKGEWIKAELKELDSVKEMRGSGLLIGCVLNDSRAKEITLKLQEKGFLVNAAAPDVIRIAPAYVVSDSEIEQFLRAMKEVLS